MGLKNCLALNIYSGETVFTVVIAVVLELLGLVNGLGSMSSIAISYGEKGPAFCGLKSDGSHFADCYGSDASIIYATPGHLSFSGLTGGDGFICGLLMDSSQPYCWGNSDFVKMGVPQPMDSSSRYVEISAGDNHLCGLRKALTGKLRETSLVDCWGYNMTASYSFDGLIKSISAGSSFSCGLFSGNRTVFCWGDEGSSRVFHLIPKDKKFRVISAGGYHVCGIEEGVESSPFCWGKSLNNDEKISVSLSGKENVDFPPKIPMFSIVGGKFHACGIQSSDRGVICWGYMVDKSSLPPKNVEIYTISSGDYFTCGITAQKSLQPVCWGFGFPTTLPIAVSPGVCVARPCPAGFFDTKRGSPTCKMPGHHMCLRCKTTCPQEMYMKVNCTPDSDILCEYNCSSCTSAECSSNCSLSISSSDKDKDEKKYGKFWAVQLPVIIAEVVFTVFLVIVVFLAAVLYVRHKMRHCQCSVNVWKSKRKNSDNGLSPNSKIRPEIDELKIRRAKIFTYEELEKATGGFNEESIVGRGSFSCVFKGVLKDGTVVAVKRAVMSSDQKKNSKEFHNELDLLSRLNHAHLLNLLGYCEEAEERLLVYEFMAHGSLHQHLHGVDGSKEPLDWIRRVTIAVQTSRGIEYLHGYACPPVIHRDIKSSNILIDEEHNARVADFGLSLLGPTDSSSPLAELPAGTLGYLDPEYYRLHYLTTKSDVYSFGVLLLEILSGRKAIDMKFEDGNIVEWAVPLIRSGDITAILDTVLNPPPDVESLRRIANVACKCVRMRGKDRPSMDKVTTSLERALALLMGTPCSEQPILPTEVVLGSSRMHKKPSQRSSNPSENDLGSENDQRTEFRAPSWITFPSVTSSQRRKSSVSEAECVDARNNGGGGVEGRNLGSSRNNGVEGLNSLEEEIGPASPQESLFLKHNF